LARHNREGEGTDQRGFCYNVSYQPDWLRHVKVTRLLESGRQSTMILFRNPAERGEREPGDQVRTRVRCPDQDLDVQVTVADSCGHVRRVRVACAVPSADGDGEEEVVLTFENGLPLGGPSSP